MPPMVTLASLVLVVPPTMRRDLGSVESVGAASAVPAPFRRYRRLAYRRCAGRPGLGSAQRRACAAVAGPLRKREPLPDRHIADELFTVVASGHETTASSLAWAVERLTRHPQLLARLTEEVDAGGSELRQATISEVQRTRPVLDATVRCTKARIRLRDWVIPENTKLISSIRLVHESDDSFPDATSFNPDRFVGGVPKPMAWIPFGGGVNRCVGAAFAHMETDVVLRILLREFRFTPTDAPGERARWRGVATVPARGARAVVFLRAAEASSGAGSASVAEHGSA